MNWNKPDNLKIKQADPRHFLGKKLSKGAFIVQSNYGPMNEVAFWGFDSWEKSGNPMFDVAIFRIKEVLQPAPVSTDDDMPF
jgi:hypothetical protein